VRSNEDNLRMIALESEIVRLGKLLDERAAHVAELEAALGWYANPDNYRQAGLAIVEGHFAKTSKVQEEGGNIARAALRPQP